MSMLFVLEWTGAIMGFIGAALLASNTRVSPYGWILFLMSNVVWIAYGGIQSAWGLVAMQVGFTFTSLLGIWRWLAPDARLSRRYLPTGRKSA